MNLKPIQIAVWEKAKGNRLIAKGTHHYKAISKDILKKTGYSVGPDTIRNFLQGRNEPRKALMDIYATYVLDGTSEEPKTYQDFETSLQQQPVLERIGDVLREGKKGMSIILVFLTLIVSLIIVVIYLVKPVPPSLFRPITSDATAIVAPNQDTLNHSTPEQALVNEILKDFPFDDSKVVSLNEAQRILEWLGVNQMTLFTSTAEPHLSGYLPTGCLLTIWIGNYGERDTYRLRASCEEASIADLEPYDLTISKPQKTVAWKYAFDDPSLSALQEDGWFLFGDSINLDLWSAKNHPDSGNYLTMRTLLGGPWLENEDYKPLTINILAHAIEVGSCAEIEVKLVDFNPDSRYQQAGFFLYYNETEIPSVSYKHVAAGRTNHIQASIRDGEYSNEHLIPGIRFGDRIIVSKIDSPDSPEAIPQKKVTSMKLKIRIKNDTYFLLYSIDDGEFRPIRSRMMNFPTPKYIGLAAFQGRPDIPFPAYPVADVIDAKFEYVIISSCD